MMQHYSAKDYGAGISNWDVLQSKDGLLYFGNLSGVLRYDGSEWQFIQIEDGNLARSMAQDSYGRIFLGSNDEFGYLDLDSTGNTYYKSLRKGFKVPRIGLVWKVLSTDTETYFLTSNYLIRFNSEGLKHWELNGRSGGFTFNNELYLTQNSDLLKLEGDTLLNLSEKEDLDFPTVIHNIVDGTNSSEKYILSFDENREYIFRNDTLLEVTRKHPFGGETITALSKTNNHSIWASTKNKGVLNFSFHDTTIHRLSMEEGLVTNLNFNIFSDQQNGVWALHQEGLSRIQANQKVMHWPRQKANNYLITGILNTKEEIYLSSLNGVFKSNRKKKFEPINYIQDRIFNILRTEEYIIAFGDRGLYVIKNSELINTNSQAAGGKAFVENNKLYIATFREGIVQYDPKTNSSQSYIKEISGFCNSIYSVDSKHWLSYKNEGIVLIDTETDNNKWQFFDQNYGLPDVNEINILKSSDGELLFTTSEGFYTLNTNPKADSSNLFIPHKKITTEKIDIKLIDQDSYGNYWISTAEDMQEQLIVKFQKNSDGSYKKVRGQLKAIPNQNFTSIHVDEAEDSVIWIAGIQGLYRYDEKEKTKLTKSFNTIINNVKVNDSVLSYGVFKEYRKSDSIPTLITEQPKTQVDELKYSDHNIQFEYSALFYEQPNRNQYSYRLVGFNEDWSAWSFSSKKEYTNLPAGSYQFKVRSKNLYDTVGSTAVYKFKILPPWYQTTWAYFLFSILIFTIIWFLMLAYSYRVRQHRKRLKLIVADRTFEVIQQKKVIEKQLLKMSNLNEEISQQRDDILEKNQELESSQEEVIAINNKLQELNQALEARVEKRTAKIKDTIQKLQQTNKDLDTFTYKTSHDLKGPISRIKGILALARFENPESKTDKYLDLIEKTTKEMDILLSKLTQVHNIYNSKVEYKAIDIPTIFTEVMEKISPLVEQSKFKFQFDLKNENELKTDKKMLELILLNLLENALIYADDKKSEQIIKLSTERKKNTFYLSIEDTGLGIPEKQLPRIFEMFYRGSEKSIGNGLGLYLVKVAVEKIGGKLSCETKEFEFTRFIIEFPLKEK